MVSPKLSPKLETGLFNSILSTSIKMSQNHFAFPSQLGAGCSDQTPEAIFFSLCLSYPHLIHQPVSVVPPSESPRICSLHPTPPLCPLLLPGPYNSPPDLLLMVVVSHIPSPPTACSPYTFRRVLLIPHHVTSPLCSVPSMAPEAQPSCSRPNDRTDLISCH